MRTSYEHPDDCLVSHVQAKRVIETLTFLVESGATLDRWAGLIAFSKRPQVLLNVVQFVDSGPATALRFLSLEWKTYTGMASTVWQAFTKSSRLRALALSLRGDCIYSGLRVPQLRHVELDGLPFTFVLNPSSPMVSNLTHLRFVSPVTPAPLQDISTLLSACSRLDSLFIDMSAVPQRDDLSEGEAANPALVILPSLRTLSFNIVPIPRWGLQLLRIIEAPKLESFELTVGSLTTEDTVLQELFRYLGTGRSKEAVQGIPSLEQESTRSGSIFPSLRYLNIENVISDLLVVPALLEAFPTVTQVTLELDSLAVLSESPHLFPNASYFTYNDADPDSFEFILLFVSQRANAGMRVLTLKISTAMPGIASDAFNGEGGDSEIYNTFVAPLHQFVDEIRVRLYEREDSEPSRLSDEDDVFSQGSSDYDEW